MPPQAFIVNEGQCEVENWDDEARGAVSWRTLVSAERTPSQSLTVGVAEVPEAPGTPLRLHRHAQAEVYYVLAGAGVISIDGVVRPLTRGDAVFIPGGALHGARAVGPRPLKLLYVFAADSFGQVVYEFPEAS